MKTAPADLSEFEVNNEVAKKTVYDKLVAKVNNIDTNGYVWKTKYNTDKLDLGSDADKKTPVKKQIKC